MTVLTTRPNSKHARFTTTHQITYSSVWVRGTAWGQACDTFLLTHSRTYPLTLLQVCSTPTGFKIMVNGHNWPQP